MRRIALLFLLAVIALPLLASQAQAQIVDPLRPARPRRTPTVFSFSTGRLLIRATGGITPT